MKIVVILLILCYMFSINVYAQDLTYKLWPNQPPGAIVDKQYTESSETRDNGIFLIRNVSEPELIVYFPKKENANGSAVVICPGGGYGVLAIDHEGHQMAKWFQEMGVVGIILKYRLPTDKIMSNKTIGPLQDAQEAIRIVRRKANEWNINPTKVGVMGFSAGGHLASTISTHYKEKVYNSDGVSAKPDFSILIYPVITMKEGVTHMGSRENLLGKNASQQLVEKYSNENRVTSETPPAFLVHSSDDEAVPVQNSILYYEALNKHKVPVEMHIYEKGGHGYGFGKGKGKGTHESWPESCKRWLKERGILERAL